jgi:hypothetical protein
MDEFMKRWLFDPVAGKIIAALLLFLIIQIIVHILNKSAANHIRNSDTRYRVRKSIAGGFFNTHRQLDGVFRPLCGRL